jgi:hypothetical protein
MKTRVLLGDVLTEIKSGIGADWANYPVLGATREGLAPAKDPPPRHLLQPQRLLQQPVIMQRIEAVAANPGLNGPNNNDKARKSGSHVTRRWRGMDSNPRSPVRETTLSSAAFDR